MTSDETFFRREVFLFTLLKTKKVYGLCGHGKGLLKIDIKLMANYVITFSGLCGTLFFNNVFPKAFLGSNFNFTVSYVGLV